MRHRLAVLALLALATPLLPQGARAAVSVTVSAPSSGATLHGLVTLGAQASSTGSRVAWVDFVVDGVTVGSDTTSPYSYVLDASRLAPGPHQLRAAAWTVGGRRTTSPRVAVTVQAGSSYTATVASAAALLAKVVALGASGGGSVLLEPGSYTLTTTLLIPSQVRVYGAATATTRLVAGFQGAPLVRFLGSGSALSYVTLDYQRGSCLLPACSGVVDTGPATTANDLVQHVRIVGVGPNGSAALARAIDWWSPGHHDMSVQDSTLDGGDASGAASAGIGLRDDQFDAASADDSALRLTVTSFRDFGIEFPALSGATPVPAERNVAADNVISGIVDPTVADGTVEAGIWLGGQDNVAVGNTVSNTGWELVWLGSNCYRCSVAHNTLGGSRSGVYLEVSSSSSVVAHNTISGVLYGVVIEAARGVRGGTPPYTRTLDVHIRSNRITASQRGVWLGVDADGTVVSGNVVRGAAEDAVEVQGLHGVTIRGNDLRVDGAIACLAELVGAYSDTGGPAFSDHVTFVHNDCSGPGALVFRDDPREGADDVVSGNIWP
jgi:hypothetical protein